jgi:PPOX class probable F420-dependent enzyme
MLDRIVKELATGKNFAALTTLFGDGHAQTQMMWVDADDDHVLINTEVHRQKYKNVQRDPRVTVAVVDATNPYHYAEVRGRVVDEVRGGAARAHIDELSQKYLGSPYGAPVSSERVILKIAPDSQRSQ